MCRVSLHFVANMHHQRGPKTLQENGAVCEWFTTVFCTRKASRMTQEAYIDSLDARTTYQQLRLERPLSHDSSQVSRGRLGCDRLDLRLEDVVAVQIFHREWIGLLSVRVGVCSQNMLACVCVWRGGVGFLICKLRKYHLVCVPPSQNQSLWRRKKLKFSYVLRPYHGRKNSTGNASKH